MSIVLFIFFGMLEVFALFSLMFKAFRLPYFAYIKEISIIAVTVTITSYIIRVFLDISMIVDIATHIILYIIFFRYLIKVRVWRALIISLTYLGYAVINIGVFSTLTSTSILSAEQIVNEPNGLHAYIIQITTVAIAATVAYIIHKFNLGFSFIIRPPHDFFIKSRMSKLEFLIITSTLTIFIIFFLTVYLILHHEIYISLPLILVSYIALVYLAYRRDMKA